MLEIIATTSMPPHRRKYMGAHLFHFNNVNEAALHLLSVTVSHSAMTSRPKIRPNANTDYVLNTARGAPVVTYTGFLNHGRLGLIIQSLIRHHL
jgi:hypothetical protein